MSSWLIWCQRGSKETKALPLILVATVNNPGLLPPMEEVDRNLYQKLLQIFIFSQTGMECELLFVSLCWTHEQNKTKKRNFIVRNQNSASLSLSLSHLSLSHSYTHTHSKAQTTMTMNTLKCILPGLKEKNPEKVQVGWKLWSYNSLK